MRSIPTLTREPERVTADPRNPLRLLSTRTPDLVAILCAALVLVALVLTAQSVLVSFATHSPLPQEDEWYSLRLFRSLLSGDHLLRDLLSQHNEHRIAFPRLVLFSDYLFFGGTGIFDVTVIFVTQGLLAGLFLFLLYNTRPPSRGSAAIAAMAMLLLFSLRQSENFVWGFQVQFVGVFAVAALAATLFAAGVPGARLAGTPSPWSLAAAYAFAGVATFTMSNGLVAGPVLVVLSLLARAPRRHVLGALAATVACVGTFFFRYEILSTDNLGASWLRDPLNVVLYTAAYIGNFLDGDMDAALFLGGAGLLAAAAILVRFALGRDRDRGRLALLGILLFTTGSAAMTALGRSGDGLAGAMSSRYSTGAACFWSALLVCGWSLSGATRPRHGIALRVLVGAASLVLLTAILPAQAPTVSLLEERAYRRDLVEDALDQGLVDEPAIESLDDGVDIVREITPFLRERAISIFSTHDAHLLGRPLAEAGPSARDACPGTFDAATPAPSLGPDGVRAKGTNDLRSLLPGSRRIYLADDSGTVVGLASTTFDGGTWSGYARAAPNTRLRAYARLGSGQLCELGPADVSAEGAADPTPSPP